VSSVAEIDNVIEVEEVVSLVIIVPIGGVLSNLIPVTIMCGSSYKLVP
jgi:hypothetical protein